LKILIFIFLPHQQLAASSPVRIIITPIRAVSFCSVFVVVPDDVFSSPTPKTMSPPPFTQKQKLRLIERSL